LQPPPSHDDQRFTRSVPKLIGDSPSQAAQALAPLNLKLGQVVQDDGRGIEGTIYTQNPQPGQWVYQGTSVDVHVVHSKTSDGPKPVPQRIVPLLDGKTTAEANEILKASGLQLGKVSTGNSAAPAGKIYSQSPPAQSKVPPDTIVNVIVAGARAIQSVRVPNLIHTDVKQASAILMGSRLRIGEIGSQENDTYVGQIISQSPGQGAQVEIGTPINVTVAKQMPLVSVPDLVKRDEGVAVHILNSAGLTMGGVRQIGSNETSGTILSQSPAPGKKVRKGSLVEVAVSRQIVRQLTVMIEPSDPEAGLPIQFHAHLVPDDPQFKYQFSFGDSPPAGSPGGSVTTHTYQASGQYQVQAVAIQGPARIESESVTVIAKNPLFHVSLDVSPKSAKRNTEIVFSAKINRSDILPTYRYDFGDGTSSDWSNVSTLTHGYRSIGNYAVTVMARVGQVGIASSAAQSVNVFWLPPWAGYTTAILALAGAGFTFNRINGRLRKLVRASTHIDPGTQGLRIESREDPGASARLRVVHPPGEQKFAWFEPQKPGEGGSRV
jgi:beta-lactam-binding protein with PASTA domain